LTTRPEPMSNVANAIITPAASQAPPRLGDVAIAQYCTAAGRILFNIAHFKTSGS
jgi:hypothetical protein